MGPELKSSPSQHIEDYKIMITRDMRRVTVLQILRFFAILQFCEPLFGKNISCKKHFLVISRTRKSMLFDNAFPYGRLFSTTL